MKPVYFSHTKREEGNEITQRSRERRVKRKKRRKREGGERIK